MPVADRPKIRCYGIIPLDKEFHPLIDAMKTACKEFGVQLVLPEEITIRPMPIAEVIYSEIARSDLLIADVSRPNSNIFYEIGFGHALGKPVIFLVQEEIREISFDPKGYPYLRYTMTPNGLIKFQHIFHNLLEDFIRAPRRFRPFLPFPARFAQSPYVVDLEKMEPREFENLCFELIAQMRFRRVEWGKEFREIDVVATLPKKDPDGYEYQELWLISMGRRAPVEMMIEMAVEDPDHFLHRLLRYPESFEELFSKYKIRYDVPVTLLLISRREGGSPSEFFEHGLRRMERRLEKRPYPFTIRVRLWDSSYLTNLIQQYPQIAFKYFSEESRAKSKYRKTPEEFYEENVKLTEEVLAVKSQLEEEKKRRFIAERDAAWKDVAFKAAHKLGNPVYAIETDLQNLKKRIKARPLDAFQIAEEMGSSLEKAKSIIEQFKSLTKVQEISLQPIDIVPLIQNTCRIAKGNGIEVEFQAPNKSSLVMADPNKITECFDELVANALHWLDKSEKKIAVSVEKASKKDLPEYLDNTKEYLKIRFEDNGCGVSLENKEKIFAPFYTTHPHGTGIGLSLVQRIIEKHKGIIQENGKPGEGASFKIYLPVVATKKK